MLENIPFLDTIKTMLELLCAPFIALIAYLFKELKGLRSHMNRIELKVAEEYLTKHEFNSLEAKLLGKMDEHKQEAILRYSDISSKITSLDNKLFSTVSGKSIDNN